jgi:hypothetical protein
MTPKFDRFITEMGNPYLEFKGNQKGLDGEILYSLWNLIYPSHKMHGSTIALSPDPSEEEKAAKLSEMLKT